MSAKSPDGPTKVKILMEIAAEHNVVWEAQSFVEPDPKDTELLVSNKILSVNGNSCYIYSLIPTITFTFTCVLEWSKLVSVS